MYFVSDSMFSLSTTHLGGNKMAYVAWTVYFNTSVSDVLLKLKREEF